MKVYRVYVVEDFGYDGIVEEEIGCFSNPDDADKCADLCQQMIENGHLHHDYVGYVAYEIEDLETVMKRLEEMCKSEDESR